MSEDIKNINLSDIPENIKSWQSLTNYNKQWVFVSNEFRYRITEHLAAIDYFQSIFNWLKPGLVFGDVHKRMVLILVASVYECVLTDAISRTAQKELNESKLLKQFVPKDRLNAIERDEFEQLINNGNIINNYDNDWKEYLHRIRGVRNWIHLAKERDENLENWLKKQTIELLKDKIEAFRLISETYFSQL